MANTVYIAPVDCNPDVTELAAAATISPGEVLVITAGAFAVAGADEGALPYFALENILGEITEDYATGDTVQGARPKSGEYYEMTLAASQTIAKDAALTTDASGNLIALGGGSNTICYADEAVTTTGATGKIRVYIK